MTDPLEDLLSADPNANQLLRDRLRERTTSVVRRGRRLRRLGRLAVLAACFVAGVVVARFWPVASPEPESGPPPIARHDKPSAQPAPAGKKEPPAPEPPAPEPQPPSYVSIVRLEWQAFDSDKERAELYLKAGNRYFAEMQDHESALRCYRQALDADPQIALRADPADNWLLAALKESRRKEN